MAYNQRIYKGKSLFKNIGNYTVVDIETTSLDSFYGEILEISAVKVRNKKIASTFSKIVKVSEEIGPFTTNLTGITNEMVKNEGEDLIDVLSSFSNFVEDNIIIGHNVNFDINFIYDNMEKYLGEALDNDYIDTLRLSRKLLPSLAYHRLDDLIEYFNLEVRDKHRALNDCLLTNDVYLKLCDIINEEECK